MAMRSRVWVRHAETQPLYARVIADRDLDDWVRLEIESNPLPICTRPPVLHSARRT